MCSSWSLSSYNKFLESARQVFEYYFNFPPNHLNFSGRYTAAVPFLFILMVSAVKEIFEDIVIYYI